MTLIESEWSRKNCRVTSLTFAKYDQAGVSLLSLQKNYSSKNATI